MTDKFFKNKILPTNQSLFNENILKNSPGFVLNYNAFRCCIVGKPRSGKSQLFTIRNFIPGGPCYQAFHKVYMICPKNSIHSVENHPFENHNRVFDISELTPDLLKGIIEDCENNKKALKIRELWEKKQELKKQLKSKKKKKYDSDDESDKEESEEEDIPPKVVNENVCIIFDDVSNSLQNKHILKELVKMCSRSRHLNLSIMVLCQFYTQIPLCIRKLMNFIVLFQHLMLPEIQRINNEVFGLKKDQYLKLFKKLLEDKEPYSTLLINKDTGQLYSNFEEVPINEINQILSEK